VSGLSGAVAIAAGNVHGLALVTNGAGPARLEPLARRLATGSR
jgi:hypothetical protein